MSDQKSSLLKNDDKVVTEVVTEVSKVFDVKTMQDKSKLAQVLYTTMRYVATTYPTMDGQQKKKLVVVALQTMCPFDAIDLIIPGFCDLLIDVDKNDLRINPVIAEKVKSCFARLCCSSKKSAAPTPPVQ
jgi:hypothetical protein